MLKAIVKKIEVETKTGTAARSGKPYAIPEQTVMLSFPNGELREHKLTLENENAPLEPGNYQPNDRAVYMDRFDLKVSSRARDWVRVGA
jgi:hypothetical protein